jgi:pantetheine-phosphate adenylyltransferase
MRIGLYPGTFDPITLGHIDIIQRATVLVDRLVIGVAINRDKGPLFTLEERVAMIEAVSGPLSAKTGVEIVVWPFENLLIDCARDVGAGIIIRGLRAVADFEYEFQMVGMNRRLDASIETVFLMAGAEHQAIASKLVKEIARLGGDVSKFVTPPVREALAEVSAATRREGRAPRPAECFASASVPVDRAAGDLPGILAEDVEVERHVERHRLDLVHRAEIGARFLAADLSCAMTVVMSIPFP